MGNIEFTVTKRDKLVLNKYLDLDLKRVTLKTFYEELRDNIKINHEKYDDINTVKYDTLNKLKDGIESIEKLQKVSV